MAKGTEPERAIDTAVDNLLRQGVAMQFASAEMPDGFKLVCLDCGYVPHTVTKEVRRDSRRVICQRCGRPGWTVKSAPVTKFYTTKTRHALRGEEEPA